ncbi:glycosyltransferase family 2 protein [Patescibacteria group bacterium]|nr:glycosyltransferase family 2 protein [Patescibacteria group bacterium]
MLPFASVVIINYNGKEYLQKCLNALQKTILPKHTEIVVVDDASTDGSAKMVQQKFPFAKLVVHKTNKGPTAARNTGAREVKGNDVLIFCDSDAVVEMSTIKELLILLEDRKDVALVGARVIPEGEEKMWWNFGYFPSFPREIVGFTLGWFMKRGIFAPLLRNIAQHFVLNYADYEKSREVDWVVEKCFAVRKDVFEKVGGFDEHFFMFMEGPDLCKRIKDLGWEIWYEVNAQVVALPHVTHPQKREQFFNESEEYYHKKHSFLMRVSPPLWRLLRKLKNVSYFRLTKIGSHIIQ